MPGNPNDNLPLTTDAKIELDAIRQQHHDRGQELLGEYAVEEKVHPKAAGFTIREAFVEYLASDSDDQFATNEGKRLLSPKQLQQVLMERDHDKRLAVQRADVCEDPQSGVSGSHTNPIKGHSL
jgi:hypothetical protein